MFTNLLQKVGQGSTLETDCFREVWAFVDNKLLCHILGPYIGNILKLTDGKLCLSFLYVCCFIHDNSGTPFISLLYDHVWIVENDLNSAGLRL